MSPDDRREAIVSAARAVMQRQGIAATTVRDVAAELGTSSGLIHHYVDSMDELLAEAFERAAEEDLAETAEAVTGATQPVDRLRNFMNAYARTDSDGGMQLWLDAWSEAARNPALRRTSKRLNEQWHALLSDIIAAGRETGDFDDAEPNAAAWIVLSLLDGLALQSVAHPQSITPQQRQVWSRHGVEVQLGLAPGRLDGGSV